MKSRRYLGHALLFLFITVVILSGPLGAAAGAEKDYSMPRLEMRLEMAEDGSLEVQEERTVTFKGSVNGFFQYIPLDQGVDIQDVQVWEEGKAYAFNPGNQPGPPGTFFVRRERDSVFIDWSIQARNETRTFLLTYRIDNAVLVHEDTAELYMKFIGDDWNRGVDNAVVYLTLPPGVSREDLYVFGHGPLQGDVVILEDGRVSWQVSPLPSKTFLEGRVLFPANLVPEATKFSGKPALGQILQEEENWAKQTDRIRLFKRIEWLLAAALILTGMVAAFLFWRRYGREHRPDYDGDYYRELPGEYSPAELGILWRFGKITSGDLTATILDLARRGYVALDEDQQEVKGFLRSKTEIQYFIQRKKEDYSSLPPHETKVMDFLFRQVAVAAGTVSFKEIEQYAQKNQRRFLAFWTDWQKELKARGVEREFFDPLTQQGKMMEILLGVGMLAVSFLAFMMAFYVVFIALWVASIILILAGAFLRRRSQSGVNDFARWRAFRRFLLHFSEMERSTIPALVIWEHYLVYAVTLGVAKEVLKQLQVVYPNLTDGSYRFGTHWYMVSGAPGRGGSPVSALENLTGGLQKSFQAATSSSSSKGGGGGFSGGGGGGFGGGGGGIR